MSVIRVISIKKNLATENDSNKIRLVFYSGNFERDAIDMWVNELTNFSNTTTERNTDGRR